ncbi:MAG: hypothetical protein OFPII_20440 [Osedax symbiont Rs1]|nr:MAG: hypothetical protein OFPII_20440 [Osedax symbiont Rs1]
MALSIFVIFVIFDEHNINIADIPSLQTYKTVNIFSIQKTAQHIAMEAKYDD